MDDTAILAKDVIDERNTQLAQPVTQMIDPVRFAAEVKNRKLIFNIIHDFISDSLIYNIDYGCLEFEEKVYDPATKTKIPIKNPDGTIKTRFSEPQLFKTGAEKICALCNLQPIYKTELAAPLMNGECKLYVKDSKQFVGMGVASRATTKDGDLAKCEVMVKKSALFDCLSNSFGVRSILKEIVPDLDELMRMKRDKVRFKKPVETFSSAEQYADDPTDDWETPAFVTPIAANPAMEEFNNNLDQIHADIETVSGVPADLAIRKDNASLSDEQKAEIERRKEPASPEDVEFVKKTLPSAAKKNVTLPEGVTVENLSVGVVEDFKADYKKAMFGGKK